MDRAVVETMMSSAPVEWRAIVNRTADLAEAVRDADSQAVRAARIAAYLTARKLGAAHDKAVRESNAVAAKVRKALGFTIARDDIDF